VIKNELGTISDRALSISLRQLQDRKWIERGISTDAYPPQTFYRAINAALTAVSAVTSRHAPHGPPVMV
jgi:DNA-binding HxlR family transcriptional regulator